MSKESRNIPKKFLHVDKSFIDRVYSEQDKVRFSGFSAFPKKVSFYGRDKDEEIIFVVRRHWIAYLPDILILLLVFALPVLFISISSIFPILGTAALHSGIFVLSIGIGCTLLLTTFLKWYYTLHIVTDQRIVVVKMDNAFYHSFSEAQLEKIEDITHQHIGILGTLFDVGSLDIDTAGHGVDFKLSMLPQPREMQDILNDLLEIKQEGGI
jgi:hypothetical protein